MVRKVVQPDIPSQVWDDCDFTSIHTVVLFADLENSVMYSNALAPPDYNALVDSFQRVMLDLVEQLKADGVDVGEYSIAGDELKICFYNPNEVVQNYQLDGPEPLRGNERDKLKSGMQKLSEQLIFDALKAGIQLKNKWLVLNENIRRSKHFLKPMGLGIGIHYGKVYVTRRADGICKAEGYAINFAKRVESFSRQGEFSHFMLSQDAHDLISTSVRGHAQVKQRIYFHRHTPAYDSMKGVTQAGSVFELKYWHRIGMPTPLEVVEQYKLVFGMNKSEPWAYYQLFDYYAFEQGDWETAMVYAEEAHSANQHDELVLLHLAKCCLKQGFLSLSFRYAEKAIQLNSGLDLAYEHLAEIAASKDDTKECISLWQSALLISPKSPSNHLNLALALLDDRQVTEGAYHLKQAVHHFPEYLHMPGIMKPFTQLREQGKLSRELEEFLSSFRDQA